MKKLVNKKEFLKNMDGFNEDLLLRVMTLMKEYCLSARQVSKELCITEKTLDRFLRSDRKMQLVTLSKIDKWVEEMEKV